MVRAANLVGHRLTGSFANPATTRTQVAQRECWLGENGPVQRGLPQPVTELVPKLLLYVAFIHRTL